MNEPINTGFKDKSGRSIYTGDTVQHRLGKFGTSGGTQNLKVISFGKKYHLVGESENNIKYGGRVLTEKTCENLVVIKSDQLGLV